MEPITDMEYVEQVEEVKRGRGRPRKERIIGDEPTVSKNEVDLEKLLMFKKSGKNKNLDQKLVYHLRKTISPNTIERTIKASMLLVQCVVILM